MKTMKGGSASDESKISERIGDEKKVQMKKLISERPFIEQKYLNLSLTILVNIFTNSISINISDAAKKGLSAWLSNNPTLPKSNIVAKQVADKRTILYMGV